MVKIPYNLNREVGKKTSAQYIINAVDYLTRSAEAQLVKDCSAKKCFTLHL